MSLSLPLGSPLLWVVRTLCFCAMTVCLWLLVRTLSGDISTLAGCGQADGCAEVMGSAWSRWFHIPVTLFAALLHLSVLCLTLPTVQRALGRTGDQLLAAAAVVLAGSAVYFLSILYFKLKQHCPWCLGLHVAGITAAALILTAIFRIHKTERRGVMEAALLSGMVAVGVLAAGQVWGPKPDSHRITSGGLEGAPAAAANATGSGQPGKSVRFFDGKMIYDPAALPMLGAPDSRIVLVEYFDYTCSSCRQLGGDLKALKKKWPGVFGVIVLPAPLERSCNPLLKDAIHDHQGACELAKLALAMWKVKPSAFVEFHEFLMALPLPAHAQVIKQAKDRAVQLGGQEILNAAASDPWVSRQLQENASAYTKLTFDNIAMPKLLLHSSNMMHGLARDEATFIKIMEDQFQLTVSAPPAQGASK